MRRHAPFAILCAVAFLALTSAGLSVASVAAQVTPSPGRSTRDGVYTAAQASRGEELFNKVCSECHSGRLWGVDWDTKTLADVYDFISRFMPESAPGSLSAQQVRDAMAYILSTNELPAGASEIPVSVDDLKQIRIAPALPK
jgi:hypothetical protein